MPVRSKAQAGMMGAELGRRRKGLRGRMPSMSTAQLEEYLEGSKMSELPERTGLRAKVKRGKR